MVPDTKEKREGEGITLLIKISKVLVSNLCGSTGYPYWRFLGFTITFQSHLTLQLNQRL